MAQSVSRLIQDDGDAIDYTPSGEVTGGNIVVVNSVPMLAMKDIGANKLGSLRTAGVWEIPKATGAVDALAAVYWDENGSPVTGDALSGAATTTESGNLYLGLAAAAALAGGDTVKVIRII